MSRQGVEGNQRELSLTCSSQNLTDGLLCAMVVVHRARGYRFVIYTLEHEPAHVHITGPGQAKINLLGRRGVPELVWNHGIKRSEMRRLFAEVVARRNVFLD